MNSREAYSTSWTDTAKYTFDENRIPRWARGRNLIRYNIFPDGKSDLLSFLPPFRLSVENPLSDVYTRAPFGLKQRDRKRGEKKSFLALTFYSKRKSTASERNKKARSWMRYRKIGWTHAEIPRKGKKEWDMRIKLETPWLVCANFSDTAKSAFADLVDK